MLYLILLKKILSKLRIGEATEIRLNNDFVKSIDFSCSFCLIMLKSYFLEEIRLTRKFYDASLFSLFFLFKR